ncbi:MAG: epoxyqueuosine reductase QueH [Spirochaetales bacterium]|nr:epoxyqueuosine reductase QueH [Spirochaetales bacterium]
MTFLKKKASMSPQLRKSVQNREMILLHICCAPCGSASVERLLRENREVTLFFSNSNIAPEEEYLKRLKYAEKLASHYNIPLIKDNYEHERWLTYIAGLEDEPEKGKRCSKCFYFNLENTSRKAAELGIKEFTTTLTISPHKNSGLIFETGGIFQGFKEYDFKKKDGFRRSIELSKELDLYRQDYCGCEFSLAGRSGPGLKG